jgi:arylsulfatase A-like enzyme/Flp pilus assembly protein TadD
MRRIRTAAIFLVCGALTLGGDGCGRSSRDATPGRPSLLLVTLDTTRADRLGCYGYRQAETPRLDRLAAEGWLAVHAVAVAPLTLPSHASILTGLYPPRHGVRDNADFRLPDGVTTLAEHLKRQGYSTAAVVGSLVLTASLGLNQGFDAYNEPGMPRGAAPDGRLALYRPIVERPASEVTDAAIAALDRIGGGAFFLWVHYYDPHHPYSPPPPYAARFAERPYDGEIASTDAQLGRLLDDLSRRGVLDRTLVVATADHGESLGEHGEKTHGLLLYDADIRVPLLLRLPGVIPSGRRYEGVVSGVDLVPTVLDLLGVPPLPGSQGRSFAAAARGGDVPAREPAYSEAIYGERVYGWAPTYALREIGKKFIEAPEPEIYDLSTDPGETANLAAARSEEVASWRSRLRSIRQELGHADSSARETMDADARAKLLSLGYLSGGASDVERKTRPDPKRLVAEHVRLLEAKSLVGAGRPKDALALAGEVLKADPENPAALALSGMLLFTAGRRDLGLSQLAAAALSAPGVYENQWNLANALHVSGRLEEAARAYRSALALQPSSAEAHHALGNALVGTGDAAGAVREYEEAIRLGLASPAVRLALGAALAASGDPGGAEASLRAAVEADPGFAEGWNKLGIFLEKAGRKEDARQAYRQALDASPGQADALFNHAKVSLLLGDRASAEREVRELLGKHPEYPAGRFLLGHVRLAAGDKEGARVALRQFLGHARQADARMVESARKTLEELGD